MEFYIEYVKKKLSKDRHSRTSSLHIRCLMTHLWPLIFQMKKHLSLKTLDLTGRCISMGHPKELLERVEVHQRYEPGPVLCS